MLVLECLFLITIMAQDEVTVIEKPKKRATAYPMDLKTG